MYQISKLPSVTTSENTKEQYHERAMMLIRKARKEMGIASYEDLPLKQFVGWLIADKNNLAYASWKMYRRSLLFFIEQLNTDDKEEAYDLLLNTKPDKENHRKTGKTSNIKQKNFPINDFIQIIAFIDNSPSFRSQFFYELKCWLYAGILTGLRPVEWTNAEYHDENQTLIVKNAKNSNGRAHGELRTLHLDSLTSEERKYIVEHLKNVKKWQNLKKFEYFKKSCADLLTKTAKKALGKRKTYPSLYSLRHQFSADAKASGLTTEEIAALMGHAVNDTAITHYAKKNKGNSLCRVKANPDEVKKIRKITPAQKLDTKLNSNFDFIQKFNNKIPLDKKGSLI